MDRFRYSANAPCFCVSALSTRPSQRNISPAPPRWIPVSAAPTVSARTPRSSIWPRRSSSVNWSRKPWRKRMDSSGCARISSMKNSPVFWSRLRRITTRSDCKVPFIVFFLLTLFGKKVWWNSVKLKFTCSWCDYSVCYSTFEMIISLNVLVIIFSFSYFMVQQMVVV